MAIAWQNVGYNQPPHLGYYLPDFIDSFQGTADVVEPEPKPEEATENPYDLDGDKMVTLKDIKKLIDIYLNRIK
jgi:hypothetical protein